MSQTLTPIKGYEHLTDGQIIHTKGLPDFTLGVVTIPDTVGSVSIYVNGVQHTEGLLPYSFPTDNVLNGGGGVKWTPSGGTVQTIYAVPYTQKALLGVAGKPLTIHVYIDTTCSCP